MAHNNILIRRYIIVGERRLSNYWWAIVIFLGSCGFLTTGICSYLGIQQLSLPFLESLGQPESPSVSAIYAQRAESTLWETPNLLNLFNKETNILPFFPQGLLMCFYGSLGFLLSIYWSLLIFWNVGGGFNEFNKKDGFVRIFRWGYPGKNRKIDLSYSLNSVEAIRVELKQGIDAQRTIYLRLKGKREIPLTGIGQPLTLKEIEKQASELANFLQVSLEA